MIIDWAAAAAVPTRIIITQIAKNTFWLIALIKRQKSSLFVAAADDFLFTRHFGNRPSQETLKLIPLQLTPTREM